MVIWHLNNSIPIIPLLRDQIAFFYGWFHSVFFYSIFFLNGKKIFKFQIQCGSVYKNVKKKGKKYSNFKCIIISSSMGLFIKVHGRENKI
jgi:hypothetical protein